MFEFSKRSMSVSPSLTLAITAKANELKAQGVPVISFGVGEPDFNTPDYIVEGAKVALDKGMTKYTASAGMPTLRQTIADKLYKDNQLSYNYDQIVVSSGAKQSLFNAMQILVDEGDEVIIPSPYWLTYPQLVTICGGKCVFVECSSDDGFILQPSNLERAITDKTKVLLLNSPNNPTGAVYSQAQLSALAKVLAKYPDIWVIADEIYEKLVYDNNKHYSIASFPTMYERTIVVNGMSKAYAMTGWRIGYSASPSNKVAKLMDSLQSHESSNANTIAQYASQVALSTQSDFIDNMRSEFAHRRDCMLKQLSKIEAVKPINAHGAFYIMVDVSSLFGKCYNDKLIDSANTLAQLLISTVNVVVIPCEGFGASNFIRLSYATNIDNIIKGIDKIAQFVAQVK